MTEKMPTGKMMKNDFFLYFNCKVDVFFGGVGVCKRATETDLALDVQIVFEMERFLIFTVPLSYLPICSTLSNTTN